MTVGLDYGHTPRPSSLSGCYSMPEWMKWCVGWEDGKFITHELVRLTFGQLYNEVSSLFLWVDRHKIPILVTSGSVLLSCITLSTRDMQILHKLLIWMSWHWYWRVYKKKLQAYAKYFSLFRLIINSETHNPDIWPTAMFDPTQDDKSTSILRDTNTRSTF